MQLLRRLGDDAADVGLDLVENPEQQRPAAFERPGQLAVARFGTDDLLVLAEAMAELGYMPTWLDLRDSRFNELDPEDDQFLSAHLLADLRRPDLESARRFLAVEGRGVLVLAVELSSPKGIRFRINQDGILTVGRPITGLADDLTSGWRRVISA